MYVRFQHPAVCVPVFAVIVGHGPLEPSKAVMGAFAFLAGIVIPYKAAGYGVIKDVVRYGMEDNLVNKRRGLDQPLFRLENVERLKFSGAVGFGLQNVG